MIPASATSDLSNVTARVLAGKAFLLKTPPCEGLFVHVDRWLATGAPGGMVYGRPRLGKTSATRWVLNTMRERYGNSLSWYEVQTRNESTNSEGAFFQHMLRSVRHTWKGGLIGDKRDRLTEFFVERALASTIGAAILYLDETQYLPDARWKLLQNMTNEVDQAGARLFVLSVGQHQMVERRRALLEADNEEIVGRFMAQSWEFPGLRSESDIAICLEGYDNASYPQVDGCPFLSLYVPIAHACGWKLRDQAPALWNAFCVSWKSAGGAGAPIVAMHYLNSSVCSLLNALAAKDAEVLTDIASNIGDAVMRSGYASALSAMRTAK